MVACMVRGSDNRTKYQLCKCHEAGVNHDNISVGSGVFGRTAFR